MKPDAHAEEVNAMLGTGPLLLTLAVFQTWTVDKDGPADFADLPAAIAAAAPGDLVLVEPGTYSSFVLTKALSILGRSGGARPLVQGESLVTGAPSFTLAGLQLVELLVSNVPGRARIDDCVIGHTGTTSIGTTNSTCAITACDQVVISRSTLQGKSGDYVDIESAGLELVSSRASIVDSEITGGKGGVDFLNGFPGETGIRLTLGSEALLAGTDVFGGPGGFCVSVKGLSFGGDGIRISGGSTFTARGSSSNVIAAGPGCGSGGDGLALTGAGTALVSGVTLQGGVAVLVELVQPEPAQPYVIMRGESAPGDSRRFNLFGPDGDVALVAVSFGAAWIPLTGVDGALWMDPAKVLLVFALEAVGQESASTLLWPIPADPTLAGASFVVQAATAQEDPPFLLTNPTNVIVRF